MIKVLKKEFKTDLENVKTFSRAMVARFLRSRLSRKAIAKSQSL